MKIDHCLDYLQLPGSPAKTEYFLSGKQLVDKKSKRIFPIVKNMIDFQGNVNLDSQMAKTGLLFRINSFYSDHLDPWLRTSIFAGGGIGFIKTSRKMKQWIDRHVKGDTLFIEPEDNRLISYIGPDKCLTVGDFASKNVFPLESDYPNINASHEQLPIRPGSFQNIISNFVLEHVKHPRQHMMELTRILEPGGYLILGGPGDIYPSHRVPYNYFNIIRYGYFEMFKENNLELVEEYFPAKTWMSILYICYTTTVRNSWFNRNQFTKFVQMIALAISLVVFPILNVVALFFDLITPFEQRGYSVYLALLRKPEEGKSKR